MIKKKYHEKELYYLENTYRKAHLARKEKRIELDEAFLGLDSIIPDWVRDLEKEIRELSREIREIAAKMPKNHTFPW